MTHAFRKSDPDENASFARDWGGGRFHARLAAEAECWLAARRKARRRGFQAKRDKIRAWRAPA